VNRTGTRFRYEAYTVNNEQVVLCITGPAVVPADRAGWP
jgi:hypothetical protein